MDGKFVVTIESRGKTLRTVYSVAVTPEYAIRTVCHLEDIPDPERFFAVQDGSIRAVVEDKVIICRRTA